MFQRILSALLFALLIMSSGEITAILFAEPTRTVDPNLETLAKGTDPMPRIVPSISATRRPEFVAADRVLLPDGTVDPALFRLGEADIIQTRLAKEPSDDGCIHFDLQDSSDFPSGGRKVSVNEAIRSSENVIVAEVTGRIYGYHAYDPGTLLRVVTGEVLGGKANRELFYVHFPVGSFRVGEHRVCRTTIGFPAPPGIGERLLLMYYDSQVSTKTEFLEVRATNVVVLPKRGSVVFSEYFSSKSKISNDWTSEQLLDSTRLQMSQDLKEEWEQ